MDDAGQSEDFQAIGIKCRDALLAAVRYHMSAEWVGEVQDPLKVMFQMDDAVAMGLAMPESVTVALAELAGDVQESLLAMAVGTGMQVHGRLVGDRPAVRVRTPGGEGRTSVRST